jgi:hypothetical protein
MPVSSPVYVGNLRLLEIYFFLGTVTIAERNREGEQRVTH